MAASWSIALWKAAGEGSAQGGRKEGGQGGRQGSGSPDGGAAWGVPINTTISKQGTWWRPSKWVGRLPRYALWPLLVGRVLMGGSGHTSHSHSSEATYLQVLPTGSGCPPPFLQVEKQEKSRLSGAHSPFHCPSPCNATVHQGSARWLQPGWTA